MMKSDCAFGLGVIPDRISNIVPIVNIHLPVDSETLKKKSSEVGSVVGETDLGKSEKVGVYLKIGVICKIINRFLVEKKMSKDSLSMLLKIKVRDLERLISQKEIPPTLIPRVNLPLIKLYCETKFGDKC